MNKSLLIAVILNVILTAGVYAAAEEWGILGESTTCTVPLAHMAPDLESRSEKTEEARVNVSEEWGRVSKKIDAELITEQRKSLFMIELKYRQFILDECRHEFKELRDAKHNELQAIDSATLKNISAELERLTKEEEKLIRPIKKLRDELDQKYRAIYRCVQARSAEKEKEREEEKKAASSSTRKSGWIY